MEFNVDAILNIATEKIIKAVDAKINNIYSKSQSVVPVDTGRLKAGFFKESTSLNENEYKVSFGYSALNPSSRADYAIFVDWGTYKMTARKYFTPFVYDEFGVDDPTPYQ